MTSVLGEKLREAIEKKSLAATISQWDDEDNKQTLKDIPVIELPKSETKRTAFPITTNASRVTFDYVYNNAGSTAFEVASALEKQGQKFSTVTSLCYQMVKNGMFRKAAGGKLFPLVSEYEPLKSAKQLRNKALKESGFTEEPPKRKIVIINKRTGHTIETGGIAALKQETTTAPWSVDAVVDGLTLTQGRALYLKLKEIFGG